MAISVDPARSNKTAPSPVLTEEQEFAILFLQAQVTAGNKVTALAGPAGSGKTTIIRELRRRLITQGLEVTVAAMTNKAAWVLISKGLDAVTFHQACMFPMFKPPLDKLVPALDRAVNDCSFDAALDLPDELFEDFKAEDLYRAFAKAQTRGIYAALRDLGYTNIFQYIQGWSAALAKPGVLIIDEASMLGAVELEKAKEVFRRIILVGDEYQLPPVKSKAVFWEVPERIALKTIHRQAAESQPLRLATAIRNGERISAGPVVKIDSTLCKAGMPVLVWKNRTRVKLTLEIRARLGYAKKDPQVGERVICRNSSDRFAKNNGLINNSIWTITARKGPHCYDLVNDLGTAILDQYLHMEEAGHGDGIPFRYAYALTCHAAQGSEFKEVMISQPDLRDFHNSPSSGADFNKWLYTALTRAVHKVHWVRHEVK